MASKLAGRDGSIAAAIAILTYCYIRGSRSRTDRVAHVSLNLLQENVEVHVTTWLLGNVLRLSGGAGMVLLLEAWSRRPFIVDDLS